MGRKYLNLESLFRKGGKKVRERIPSFEEHLKQSVEVETLNIGVPTGDN
jgi:hypothetical protein